MPGIVRKRPGLSRGFQGVIGVMVAGGGSGSGSGSQGLRAARSRKVSVKTVANAKPATCQNQTLVRRNPTPKASRPRKEQSRAASAMVHARQ